LNLNKFIDLLLEEDVPNKDITSETIFKDKNIVLKGSVISKGNYIVSGLDIIKKIYEKFNVEFETKFLNKDSIKEKEILYTVKGKVIDLLSLERICLNIVSHMMGIATKTKEFVDLTKGTKAKILDTRKTIPGIRFLQKKAVIDGGALNHRMDLSSMVLIKENHIEGASGSIKKALESFNDIKKDIKKEIEVKNLEELKTALKFNPDIIMLDNMNVDDVKKAVEINKGKVKLEVSGGINKDVVSEYTKTGVDFISVGALTHSVKSADLSFLIKGLIK
jgi:nicotinate-nucleotide pyrophosphorylase (carboxylating)